MSAAEGTEPYLFSFCCPDRLGVLARYRQILSDDPCACPGGRAIDSSRRPAGRPGRAPLHCEQRVLLNGQRTVIL